MLRTLLIIFFAFPIMMYLIPAFQSSNYSVIEYLTINGSSGKGGGFVSDGARVVLFFIVFTSLLAPIWKRLTEKDLKLKIWLELFLANSMEIRTADDLKKYIIRSYQTNSDSSFPRQESISSIRISKLYITKTAKGYHWIIVRCKDDMKSSWFSLHRTDDQRFVIMSDNFKDLKKILKKENGGNYNL